MMSTEPNETITTLVNVTETQKNGCIVWKIYEWFFTYYSSYIWAIFVLGFLENLFVISVFVLHKSRCTVTEIYLGNMAAADLILVSGLPLWAISVSNENHWQFGDLMCGAVPSLYSLNLYSSIYFLMMVSIERYLALVKAMTIGRLRRPCWAKVICGIIWVFAAVLSVPYGLFQKVVYIKEYNTSACFLVAPTTWSIVLNINTNILGFLLPLVVTSFCTFHMICFLRNNPMRQFKKVNKERKATRLVLSVLLLFIVCWLPYNVSIFILILQEMNVSLPCTVRLVIHFVHVIFLFLTLSNSCINPVIYSMVGNQFRQKAREVYSRLLCKGPNSRMSSFPTDE